MGNAGKKVKVQLVASTEQAEKATYRAEPAVVVLEKGMACEFSVFVTPHCTCNIDDKAFLVVQMKRVKDTVNVLIEVQAETELTTKLHYDDVFCDQQKGERFVVSSMERSAATTSPSRR